MGWLIASLLGLALVCALAVLTYGESRRREAADETLIADLLGPLEPGTPPAGRAFAGQAPAGQPPAVRVRAAGQPQQAVGSPPVPAARPGEDGDWLGTQLAWITAWSQRIQEQIGSGGEPGPDGEPGGDLAEPASARLSQPPPG
jgi:hypothetical protein